MMINSFTDDELQHFANEVVAYLAQNMEQDGLIEDKNQVISRFMILINRKGRLSKWFDQAFKNNNEQESKGLFLNCVWMDNHSRRTDEPPQDEEPKEGKVLSLVKGEN